MLWANFAAMMMLGGILLPMAVKEHPKIKAKYPDTWLSTLSKITPWFIGTAAICSGVVWIILVLR